MAIPSDLESAHFVEQERSDAARGVGGDTVNSLAGHGSSKGAGMMSAVVGTLVDGLPMGGGQLGDAVSVTVRSRRMGGGMADDAVDSFNDQNGEVYGYLLMDNGAVRVRAFTPSTDPGRLGTSRLVKAYAPDGYLEVSGTVFLNDLCTTEDQMRAIFDHPGN